MTWEKLFEGSLDVAPPITEEHLAAVPGKRGVVLLLAADDQPVVLLPAADMRTRTRNRLRNPDQEERSKLPDLHEITRRILWKLSHSYFETDLDYLEIARTIWPATYRQLLAHKPAWFIHVNPSDRYGCFVRTRDVFKLPGQYLGPFETGNSAEKFIEALQDAFNLCRTPTCLRQAPAGRQCSYGQMGRCLCPCDGSISEADYRLAVTEAARFAAGDHAFLFERFRQRMKEAAAKLQFEQASGLKARLDRLAEFSQPTYAQVAPAEQFQFIVLQSGPGRRKAKAFVVDRGNVDFAGLLDYPVVDLQIAALLEAMARLAAAPAPADMDLARLRMGLVSYYLFAGERRSGLILRWRPELGVAAVRTALEGNAERLNMALPKPRGRKAKAGSDGAPPADAT